MDILRLLVVDMSGNTAWVLVFLLLSLGLVIVLAMVTRRIAVATHATHQEHMARMELEHRENMAKWMHENPKQIEGRRVSGESASR